MSAYAPGDRIESQSRLRSLYGRFYRPIPDSDNLSSGTHEGDSALLSSRRDYHKRVRILPRPEENAYEPSLILTAAKEYYNFDTLFQNIYKFASQFEDEPA